MTVVAGQIRRFSSSLKGQCRLIVVGFISCSSNNGIIRFLLLGEFHLEQFSLPSAPLLLLLSIIVVSLAL